MTASHDTRLDRLRRPEHTGENRCLPCTVVNVAIAAVGAVAVGALVAVELGAAVLVAALAAIWLRGYLVPGTPALTKRYLPERVLGWFGKGRDPGPPAEFDAESYLLSAGALVETPDGSDLGFAPWFESAWRTHLAALRDAADTEFGEPSSTDETVGASIATAETVETAELAPDGTRPAAPADVAALAGLTGVDEDGLSLRWRGDAAFAHAGDERIGHWESRSAFLADVAADRALTARLDDWESLPLASRSGALGALRLFVERCPTCEGPVQLEERVVESCCSSYEVVAGRCTACNARLFEIDLPASLADARS
ncbi:hypothetical protein C471_10580 [Halorubrum saccharovorum DSM 1137]|uniref:Uncharacterized protein n=1 Tax=Halorubrum saccharovorum DSM 1137 TaxID=1227484 RepID=M0DSB6_9EURY|nr:hypothetical protein [Halorubrum saccharovorum]ELZ38400.1 hypothetical protein C471_10580 [Halorubrum saccharovorum DSM 1137]